MVPSCIFPSQTILNMKLSPRILIADDDPYILMSLEYLFKLNHFEIMIARNGQEAKNLLQEKTPDIALLDIMMPDIDGYSLCEYIKSDDKLKNTHVIFLSAKSKKDDMEKGYRVGADLFITKPFSTRTLVKQVLEVLEKQDDIN